MSKLAQKKKEQRGIRNIGKQKARKPNLKRQDQLKWEGFWGRPEICMRIHQYELPELRRIAQLGTFPTARGSLSPTARIASHMTWFEIDRVWKSPVATRFSPYFILLVPHGVRCN